MKKKLKPWLKLAVTCGLLALLYSRLDTAALAERLGNLRWEWLAVFWGILFANTVLSAFKWRLLLAADDIRQPFGTLLASYLVGSFFNMFLPSTIGGDAYRIADIGKRSARTANTAASVVVDRLAGFIALALFGLVLFPVFRMRYAPEPWLLLLPLGFMGVLLVLTYVIFDQSLLRWFVTKLPPRVGARASALLDALQSSVKAYACRPVALTALLVLSVLFQFLVILAIYSLGRALDLRIPFAAFGFFVPYITLIEMIPITIFGIGTRDAAYVWFMRYVGGTSADAAAICLLYVSATVAYVSLGGLLYLCRGFDWRN